MQNVHRKCNECEDNISMNELGYCRRLKCLEIGVHMWDYMLGECFKPEETGIEQLEVARSRFISHISSGDRYNYYHSVLDEGDHVREVIRALLPDYKRKMLRSIHLETMGNEELRTINLVD